MPRFALTAVLALIMVFASSTAQAGSALKMQLRPYAPGTPIELRVQVNGSARAETTFDLQIHYGGVWWAGGAGPAVGTNAQQYWFACSMSCTEWWRGTIPAKQDGTITIPLTTNPSWSGEFPAGITITGMINGQTVEETVTVKTK